MKFFNETLQNAIFWNTKDSVFSYIILHYFIFPNYSHEVKKKKKEKTIWGFVIPNFEVFC